ncbi:PGF-pre-PGF domain-containing protein [Methanosarcina sp. 1.H.T.1A.1]|uniref:PGF-pre-PGF domain-containing protein n=1 Tax=Methanosarcina sp. 1.H.T.1A.1 TaxID=1483602 RepID=UPI000ACEF7BE|nr:PGF-pre-PGF domain-containing protein [Methanosarcina sp. 1.H.T.1A.1]
MAGTGTGIVAAEPSVDNSTIITEIDYEETNIDTEDHTLVVEDADDIIEAGGSVIYEEDNTDIDNTNIYSSDDDITNIDNSDDDTMVIETTILENSTQEIDNSYKYSDNSQTIIQTVETTNVNVDNSQSTNVAFTESTVVNNINFVSKDSGETKVIVQDIKDDDECLETLPAGNVYTSFNIWLDNAEVNSNIEDAAVDFKVEKTWLIENNLDGSAIILNMYEGGKWVEVPVTITGEDSQFIYFNAEVSEYSTFAITSKTVTVDKVLKQTDSGTVNATEEIDKPTKNVIIKLLEVIIALLEGD